MFMYTFTVCIFMCFGSTVHFIVLSKTFTEIVSVQSSVLTTEGKSSNSVHSNSFPFFHSHGQSSLPKTSASTFLGILYTGCLPYEESYIDQLQTLLFTISPSGYFSRAHSLMH